MQMGYVSRRARADYAMPAKDKVNVRKEVLQIPSMAGPAGMDIAGQNYGPTMNESYREKIQTNQVGTTMTQRKRNNLPFLA